MINWIFKTIIIIISLDGILLSFDIRYQDVCFSNFDFKHPENILASSFLQIVWKDTTKFGIAKSYATHKGLPQSFVAAVYRSPGNVQGFYHENISKGRFKKSYCDKVHARSYIKDKNTKILTTSQFKKILRDNIENGTSEGKKVLIFQ